MPRRFAAALLSLAATLFATPLFAADPDLAVRLFFPPALVELGQTFDVPIELTNASAADAHDVEVTLDFRPDAAIVSMSPLCTSAAPGRIQCEVDVLAGRAPAVRLPITLRAPQSYGSGSIVFTVTVRERETDANPASNTATATTLLYDTIYVTTTADDGAGSLRQAILDANARCSGPQFCEIAFRIEEPSAQPWKTIRVTSPLPRLTATRVRVDGTTQTRLVGDTNRLGPEIEISGGGTVDGDGLSVTICTTEVSGLAIGGFGRNGISVAAATPSAYCSPSSFTSDRARIKLHDLYVGTDPTGDTARPNARGIGTSTENRNQFGPSLLFGDVTINHCLISGNTHSGIFGMSGRLEVTANRIGVKAGADEPLPNGNSGVFIGLGGYGSDIGTNSFSTVGTPNDPNGNVIAYNGQMGVAVARGVHDVAIRNNRIWGNGLLGIDVGLDGPTGSAAGADEIPAPVLTLAHFDPASGKTVVEGDVPGTREESPYGDGINIYGSDAADPSGYGEGQRPVAVLAVGTGPSHFRVEIAGDLTGQFVTATYTRALYVGIAKPLPEGTEQGLLTQTSEFSRAIEVR